MTEQDDVLLLQDDLDTDLSLNDNSGYDIHQLFDDDQICTDSGKKDDSRKTRASVNKPDSGSVNNSGRIIKGTAISSKKPYKRKGAKSNTSNKPAKVAKLDYTPEQISQLKSQMGISSMAQSINTLTGLMQTLVNANKDSLTQSDNNNNVQQPVVSQGSKTVQRSVTVTRQAPRQILSLDSNLDNSDVVDNFNLDYFDDDPIHPSGTMGSSPAPAEMNHSFDPAVGFNEAFVAPSSEADMPVGDGNFDWEIPQLQTEEKTSGKISSGLAKAVNASVTIKSNADSIKSIEDKYYRPENCENLCVPRVNREIWSALSRQANTQDSKMQDIQKSLVKGMIPIVQLAEQCCKSKELLDPVKTRSLLSDSICLLGHGFLSLTHRRRSIMRPYFNDKFKPICNNDVPVDTLLFGTDCTKRMKELGDYTKIPIGNPRFKFQRNQSGNYYNGHLNRGGPASRQGGRYPNPNFRGRGRGNRGSFRGQSNPRNNFHGQYQK